MTSDSSSLANGISRHILAIAPELNAHDGVEVRVVTLENRGDLHKELDRCGIVNYAIGNHNGRALSVFFAFFRIMQEFKPDIVHGHSLAIMERFAMTWFFSKTKLVTTEHGYGTPAPPQKGLHKVYMSFRHWVLWNVLLHRKSDLVIAVSKGVREDFGADVVIYNPIKFSPQNLTKTLDMFIIGTACRISEIKNPIAFCNVLKGVVERLPNAEAWIIGLPDNAELDSIVKLTLKNHPRVRLLGYRPDAPKLIAQMNCFVMTSQKEGMPTALLEAIANKVPIAFMEGGGGLRDLSEMNKEEGPFAIVVPSGDVSNMIKEIINLLQNKEIAEMYAKKAFEVAKKYFNVDSCVTKLLFEYKQLLG